ncbi:hypothetical protein Taro_032321 [Colocasia esculenta]|uniref:TOD1/MUCI70 glycosyltransferase-like domain-containing protein n=1 Tax=Colocasia esculenta TaxID=4460 RepID=A0A843W5T1_COLES|nr:hypothetical protein [Colocasia esculenta]
MSTSVFNAVSIPISDDDSDEPTAKLRVRARRRRKKPGIRGGGGFCRWIVRTAIRWWPVLLFFPVIVLLVFEVSGSSRKPDEGGDPVEVVHEEESHGNLNRLDPTTRVVNGVREPCLKILSPEEIQHLEFPGGAETNFPIKKVLYKSDSEASYAGDNDTLSRQYTDYTRFNLFTGNQTLHEREESFKVCYVAFWDEITLSAQEAEGKKVDDNHMIGKWRIVVVRDLPFSDQRLNGKIPKMLSHRLFPQARYSVWVDSKSQFRRDPLGVLEALLWRTNSVLAISEHGARSNVFDEGKAIVKKNKATPEEVKTQLAQYRQDGFPDVKRFNGKKGTPTL